MAHLAEFQPLCFALTNLCILLSIFTRKNGYEYDTAVNGLIALETFQNAQRRFDIVFMDISMPVMDGMEATREIRKLEHERRQKPALIIALTGLGSAASQQEAFSSGINLFLTKPVRFNDLRKILNDWIPDIES
ncbi:CheY-like protein [Thozetella sp. PMI_491]|nr:CheY-like protein [Thozetella sp. PMI_491]